MHAAQKKRFKYLLPLGFTPSGGTFKQARSDNKTFDTRFVKFRNIDPESASVIANLVTLSEVGFDPRRQAKQEDKMDVLPVTPRLEDPLFAHALELTYQMYQSILMAPFTGQFSVVDKAAPGYPYTQCGLPTKGDARVSALHEQLKTLLPTPLAQSFPKGDEALPDEDLADGKLRTVCLTPLFFLSWQKYYFEAQNVRMKKFHEDTWGKYGYTKQFGGFNRLFKLLEPFEVLWEADVSGWDRSVFLLWVYELRLRGIFQYYGVQYTGSALRYLFDPKNDEAILSACKAFLDLEKLRRIVFECVYPVVIMGDGSVWRRPTGNNSGSGNTTSDNTLMHSLIKMHLAVKRYKLVHDELPLLHDVLSVFAALLFGDDVAAGSLRRYFDVPTDEIGGIIISHYAEHGLLVKPRAFKVLIKQINQPFSGIGFLGSTCKYIQGIYVPIPRINKLAYSVACSMRRDLGTDSVLADKLAAIWDLLSYTDHHQLKEAIHKYCIYFLQSLAETNSPSLNAASEALRFAIKKQINWPLYMGYESQSRFQFFYRDGGRRYKSDSNKMMNDIPIGKAPRKTRALLNSMLGSKQLTSEGLKWLIVATDPFHDEPVASEGYPDLTTSNVLVQCIQQTSSVARPPTVPGTDPWDCHIFFNPNTPPVGFTVPGTGLGATDPRFYLTGITSAGLTVPTTLGSYLYSGWNAAGVPVGTDLNLYPNVQPVASLSLPSSFASGYWRLIATGCEVVNTTAELYKGGSVTCYKSPSFAQKAVTYGQSFANPAELTDLASSPPGTQAQAALFPSSRTWGATDGVYMVAHLNNVDVPYVSPLPGIRAGLILSQDINTITSGSGNRLGWLPLGAQASSPATTGPMNSSLPYDVSGSVFTGLNPNSTLQVTVKYYLERIPAISEPNLLVLTRPPCPYDPVAVELYTRIVTQLPVAVKVSDNPDGEFWASILDALSSVAPIIGTALSPMLGPAAPAIAAAASVASKAGSGVIRAERARRQAASPKSPANNKKQ